MEPFGCVLTVHSPPTIQPEERGWEIVLWLGQAFDYSTPFRAALAEIADELPGDRATVELPPYSPDEDFVEGTLTFGETSIEVYFEYSLGYLSLMSGDREALEEVAARVLPIVTVQ